MSLLHQRTQLRPEYWIKISLGGTWDGNTVR
jgi:hypothetical protein